MSWLTEKENIAENFSERFNDGKSTEVVFSGKTKENVKLFSILNDCFYIDEEFVDYKEFMDENDISDFRTLYQYIDKKEYDGALMNGTIGYDWYDDYAIWNTDLLNFDKIKIKLPKSEKWSEYMNIKDAEEIFDDFCYNEMNK